MAAGILLFLLFWQAASIEDADRLYAARRFAEAAEIYRRLLEQRPGDPALNLRLGASLASAGKHDEAIAPLEAAERAMPGNALAARALAFAYEAAGRFADAVERYEELAGSEPQFHARAGVCRYRLDEFKAAERHFRRAVESGPDNIEALTGLGMSLNALDRFAEALPLLKKAVKLAPKNRMPRLALARALSETGEFLKAEDLLLKLTAEEPKDFEAWFLLGAARFENVYYDPALEALDRSIALRPDYSPALIYRARALANLGRLEEAKTAFEEMAKQPDTVRRVEYLVGFAELEFLRGRLPEALANIEAALRLAPGDAVPHYWKSRILLHQRRIDEARTEAERAVELDPNLRHPRSLLVRIYRTLGEEEQAARQIEWLRSREKAVALGRGR